MPLVVLAGCGGGGGSSDVIDKWLDRTILFIQTEDMTGLASTISNAYVDDCENKTTTLEAWEVTFDNATSISITNVSISSKVINETTGMASATGSYKIRVQGPGGLVEQTVSGTFYLRRENSVWREFGNQSCNP